MNTSDTKTHTSSMPDNYPSYKAYGEIGIRAVPAAFPIATTYLWLAWRDVYSFTIYKSVVQKYDDDDDSDTWFTRSIDSFKNSYYGARYWKGYKPVFAVFAAPAKEILKWAAIKRRSDDQEGPQRKLSKAKINAINGIYYAFTTSRPYSHLSSS